jgi:alkylation response protein AidB-like acyl-CoA dehydrogenase
MLAAQLSPNDTRRLRAGAAMADASGWLTPRQQVLVGRHLRLLVPRSLGGAELPLPALVHFEEQLARVDGSSAWVVTLCAGALWFAGFLQPAAARALLAQRRVCWAGSGAVAGTATREGDGWRLKGEWPFASGAPMATHFTLNAGHDDGTHSAFVLPAAQVRRRPGSWQALGLRATASESFAVDDVWVSETQRFVLRPEAAVARGPLYRFPFSGLAHATLAANLGGIAQQFLDAATPLLQRPRARHLQERLRHETDALQQCRSSFYARLDAAWARAETSAAGDDTALNAAALDWVAQARAAVSAVYPLCGLRAADPREPLNRAWRDFHTASQHSIWLPSETPACLLE